MLIIRKTILYMQLYIVCFPCVYASSLPDCRMCSRLHVQYSLLVHEHKMLETCRGQEELN